MQHELAHLHRRDGLWQWIGLVTSVVWWWHPLAWKGFKALKLEAEYAADELVARQADREPDYAQALLEIARSVISPKRQAAGGAMVSGPAVGDRIKTVLTESPGKGRLNLEDRCSFLFFFVLAIVVAGFSVQSAYARYRHFQPLGKEDAFLVRETLDNLLAKHKRLRRLELVANYKEVIKYSGGVYPKSMPRLLLTEREIGLDTWTEWRVEKERYLVEGKDAGGRPLAAAWVDRNPHYPTETNIDLGFAHEYELMRLLKVLLEAGKPSSSDWSAPTFDVQSRSRMGNRTFELTVIRHRFRPMAFQAITQYIVDIDRGLLREVRIGDGRRFMDEPATLWELVEPGVSDEGIWYPRRYRFGAKSLVQNVEIKRFEVSDAP